MTKRSKETVLKLLYAKFLNKMDSIDDKLSDDQKIIEFTTIDLYDKLVVEQIKELKKQGTVPEDDDWWEQDEDKSPEIDYEEIAKEEMKDLMSKRSLNDYALIHDINIDVNEAFDMGPYKMKQAILKERIKQLKGEIQVQDNKTTKQKELFEKPTPTTRADYEAIVIEETVGMKKAELRRYANDHDLNLNLTSKATLAQIRDAVLKKRTNQLMNESDSPVKPQRNWVYYTKQIQEDIRGMDKPALIGYAECFNITVPEGLKIETIRKTIINQRAEQLVRKNTGSGLTRRKIVGRGYSSSDEEKPVRKNTIPKKVINGKFIDLNKLKNNILTVRYVKTGGFVPTVKSQHISNDVKSVIEDIINDKFGKRLFDKLETNDKRLIKRFITALKIDIDISSKEEDEYRKQFDILLGQLRAGNTNPDIKNKLKQYVVESMNSGMLTRREAFQFLYELTINT